MLLKKLAIAAAAVSLTAGPAAFAAPDMGKLAIAKRSAAAIPSGKTDRADDREEARQNAAMRAIMVVCDMDNPASNRAAICLDNTDSPG